MKKVVLIGDSIRMGYQKTVRRELQGVARVRVPRENGGPSDRVLANLEKWVIAQKPDLVHINCGLHDLKKEFSDRKSAVPLGSYRKNVREILSRIRSGTRARVIWAATTPVNEEWHHKNKPFDRFEADVAAYNKAANAIAKDLGVPVDDLFAVVRKAGRDKLLLPDGVHFKPEGYELLGKAVAALIRRHLAAPAPGK
jgi:lysophospholipase L1-like esterase